MRGDSGFYVAKPGPLRAPEGMAAASGGRVLEETKSGRCPILFLFI